MAELCLMGSFSYPGLVLQQDNKGLFRVAEDCLMSSSLNLKPLHLEEFWSPVTGFSDSSKFIKIESSLTRPVLIDIQVAETHWNSELFSYNVAEKCNRRGEVMQFLRFRSNEVGENVLMNPSLLSDLMGLQAVAPSDSHTVPIDNASISADADVNTWPSLIYPSGLLNAEKSLLDFDLTRDLKLEVGQGGQVLFNGSEADMRNLLSLVAEFYESKNPITSRKENVVPYFQRRASRAATERTIPTKSPEKANLKPCLSKRSEKAAKGKDVHKKDYFRACECLLSLMMNKTRHDKTVVLLLKKSGTEVPELLTQCSASIAGTGLAILFSVVCKIAFGRVTMCGSTEVFTGGLGLGLVWLSWSVNRLRDAILQISKTSNKVESGEEDLMKRVDRSVHEIFVSAATLIVVALLRVA